MLEFLGASPNVLFSAAIVLMLLIGLVQLIGLGDFDVAPDADLDGAALSWLGVGRLPLLMLLVLWLAAFGVIGLIGQQLSLDLLGTLQPLWLAAPVAAAIALPATGAAAGLLARFVPRDHTTAIDIDDLTGRAATVVVGRAASGSPARAQVADHHGQVHFVMVEPDNPGQIFEEGETVLLVRREHGVFRAITRGDQRLPQLDG